MVRFEKFKIWHAQGSSADLSDATMTLRTTRRDARDDVTRARDVMHDVIKATVSFLPSVVKRLLRGPTSGTPW